VLKKQLDRVDELRFIFASPTFVTEKAPKKYANEALESPQKYSYNFKTKQLEEL
jgi:hypothetical protein